MTHGLNKYVSHKVVTAGKIAKVIHGVGAGGAQLLIESDGEKYDSGKPRTHANPQVLITVDGAYVAKHAPQAGGYYVSYADGYQSFSPAEAFEDGYTLQES